MSGIGGAGAIVVLLATAVAGACGTLLRWEVLRRSGPSGGRRRAAAIAGVNLAGAVLLAGLQPTSVPDALRIVLGIGFCGSLTTFSTWLVEAVRSVEGGARWDRTLAVDVTAQLAVGVLLVVTVGRLLVT